MDINIKPIFVEKSLESVINFDKIYILGITHEKQWVKRIKLKLSYPKEKKAVQRHILWANFVFSVNHCFNYFLDFSGIIVVWHSQRLYCAVISSLLLWKLQWSHSEQLQCRNLWITSVYWTWILPARVCSHSVTFRQSVLCSYMWHLVSN